MHLPEQALGFGKAGSFLAAEQLSLVPPGRLAQGCGAREGWLQPSPACFLMGKKTGNKNGEWQVGDSWSPFHLLSHQWYLTVTLRPGKFSYFALILEAWQKTHIDAQSLDFDAINHICKIYSITFQP